MVRWLLLLLLATIVGTISGTRAAYAARAFDPLMPIPRTVADEAAREILDAAEALGWEEQERLHTRLRETEDGQLPLPHAPLHVAGGRCVAAVASAWGQLAVSDTVVGTHTSVPSGACRHGLPEFTGNVSGLTPGEELAFGRYVGDEPEIPNDGVRHADVAILCFDDDATESEHRFADVDLTILRRTDARETGHVSLVLLAADRSALSTLELPRPPPIDVASLPVAIGELSTPLGLERGALAATAVLAVGSLLLLLITFIRRRRANARALAELASEQRPKTF